MKPKKKDLIKKVKISSLKKKAWKVFSLWIRHGDHVDDDSYVRCVTCGTTKPAKEMHSGHFISRRFQATLFDERNVHPQCARCNIFLKGNWSEYYLYMREVYGQEVIDELIAESKKIKKWTAQELQEIIRKYRL